ncbi:unnamed protein product [Linum trigynum]|uniref:Uncharacterized protein n=1 Tax=Linum trigynum TaxID=586398 RepID=A0AAV2DJJ9_9ROSI
MPTTEPLTPLPGNTVPSSSVGLVGVTAVSSDSTCATYDEWVPSSLISPPVHEWTSPMTTTLVVRNMKMTTTLAHDVARRSITTVLSLSLCLAACMLF